MTKPISVAQHKYLLACLDDERAGTALYQISKYADNPQDLTRQEAMFVITAIKEKWEGGEPLNKPTPPPSFYEPEAQVLYRFWASDELLYVGISQDFIVRLSQHEMDKPWFRDVTQVTLEHFTSRTEVAEAEKLAIIRERPKYNKQHSDQTIDNHLAEIPMLEDHAQFYIEVKDLFENVVTKHGPDVWGSSWIAQGYLASVGSRAVAWAKAEKLNCSGCRLIANSKRYSKAASEFIDWRAANE